MARKAHIKILSALLSNCKRSDRDIAKSTGVSQPTVTRARQRLVDEGIIKDYFAIPDYAKLGYEFGAVTLCEIVDKTINLSEWSVLVIAPAIGRKGDHILVTLHRSIANYQTFLKKIKAIQTLLFSTENLEIKSVKVPEKPFVVLE